VGVGRAQEHKNSKRIWLGEIGTGTKAKEHYKGAGLPKREISTPR